MVESSKLTSDLEYAKLQGPDHIGDPAKTTMVPMKMGEVIAKQELSLVREAMN